INNDSFAQWELRGVHNMYTTGALYVPDHLPPHRQKPSGKHDPYDVDSFSSRTLDRVDYILTSAGAYPSEIPPNWHLGRTTPSYALYHRDGPTPFREPGLESVADPGSILDCSTPLAMRYLRHYQWAGVLPKPILTSAWQSQILEPGDTGRLDVQLPR